jgi:O-antigen ligase
MDSFRKTIDRIMDAGLLFLIVFTPLAFGSVHVWAYSLMELTVFSLLIVWALKTWLFEDFRIEKALIPVYVSFILFLAVVSLQIVPLSPDMLGSISPKTREIYGAAIPGYETPPEGGELMRSLSIYTYKTKAGLVRSVAYMGFFFLITHEVRGRKRIGMLITALLLVGFFEALYGLYGYFSKNEHIFGFKNIYYMDSASGTYVNRNHFAGYLGIVAFAGIGYFIGRFPQENGRSYSLRQRLIDYLNTARALKSGVVLIAIITLILGISFSLSRMGSFAFVFSFLFIIMVSTLSKRKHFSGVLAAILSVSLVVVLWYGLRPLEDRYQNVSGDFAKGRLPIWETTCSLIKDFPLFGTGLGTFEEAFRLYRPSDFQGNLVRTHHAHNDYLEALSEVGTAGTAPVIIGSLYLLIFLLRKWSRTGDAFARGLSLGGAGAIVFVLTYSITDFNMHIPANAMALIAVVSLSFSALDTESGGRQ